MLSRAHKTIFVHIPKTGGQSVATAFLGDLGLSWEERGALLMRRGEAGQPERLAHLFAREYVDLGFVSQAEFAAFTKFAVIRHPYARMVSEYIYRMGAVDWVAQYVPALQSRRFEAFLQQDFEDPLSDYARHFAPQVDYVMDANGALLVDHLVDQADLVAGIAPIFRGIFGREVTLPRRNIKREAAGFTAEALTQAHKDLIWARHRDDFEAFGFER
ncbi:sulfotransferase family 2 domain-containing protein [Shimia sp. Alg240-R146]|uniref:sulfotransferase family 2 domain-containing protein n=1 Tax=Shimia sp. Alg240-R146 TaxID=2993449 RepID=UPI0022E61038|nr:sulfotransferase family 2 domain-containing protein [Shimia sp. Alg240-R146]